VAVSDNLNKGITEDRLLAAHKGAHPSETQVEAEDSRWQPGQSGCPNGRPKGSRNKLSEAFLQALAEDFETHGKDSVVKVRTERPNEYLRIVAVALPKRMELEDATPQKPVREMTDDELHAILWRQYQELGITDQEVADARARREAEGRPAYGPLGRVFTGNGRA
jgi:hypothetical protein